MDILIIEDDKDNLEVLKQYICIENYGKCDGVATIEQAKELVLKYHYDLIMLDLMIKGERSTPFINFVRNTWQDNPPHICLISAASGLEKIANESHADNFISKPYDLDKLDKYLKEENNRPLR